jgi:hypothetical protein
MELAKFLENYPFCVHDEHEELWRVIGAYSNYVIIKNPTSNRYVFVEFTKFAEEFSLFDGLEEAKVFTHG